MAGYLSIRSFVVRAMLEPAGPGGSATWRGYVSDVSSGERRAWSELDQATGFIGRKLEPGSESPPFERSVRPPIMTAPALSDVLGEMLEELDSRLVRVDPNPNPEPNVTVERVRERPIGLGGLRGTERRSTLGRQTLKGGRLDARVRFQLWDATSEAVDASVLDLQSRLLDELTVLRTRGFLKFTAAETSVAEHQATVDAWRKVTTYDVLYEFQYEDPDDAPSLITTIPLDVDPETSNSPFRESSVITNHLVRWDDETAATLAAVGPFTVNTIDLLSFVPGPDPGGTVTVLRMTDEATGPPTVHPDISDFLAAVSGDDATSTHAFITLDWATFLAAFSTDGQDTELGDWDEDLNPDIYRPSRLEVTPSIQLPTANDRFEVRYSDLAGLDQQAVLYLRVNAP